MTLRPRPALARKAAGLKDCNVIESAIVTSFRLAFRAWHRRQ